MRGDSMKAVLRPSAALKARLGRLYGERAIVQMDRALDDALAVDTLARLIQESCEKHATKDGRLDYREVAADLMVTMMRNQRGA